MEASKLFLITFFAAFLGVLPPGLVNMTVAKTCVEKGKRSGIFVAVGACTIVFFQALVAILLAKYIFNHPYVRNMLLRTGLVIFIIMAIYFFVAAKKSHAAKTKVPKKNSAKSFLKGMMISALNVFPIPYFVAISTAINARGDYEYDLISIILFSLAACLGTFTVLYIYVVSFLKIEKHTQSFSKYSNYFMAGLMVLLIIVALVRIYCYG